MSNYTFVLKPFMSQSLERLSEDLELKRPDVLRVAIGLLRAVVDQLKSGGEEVTITAGGEPKAILVFSEFDVVKQRAGQVVSPGQTAASTSDEPTYSSPIMVTSNG